jgi:hypothetical protein
MDLWGTFIQTTATANGKPSWFLQTNYSHSETTCIRITGDDEWELLGQAQEPALQQASVHTEV